MLRETAARVRLRRDRGHVRIVSENFRHRRCVDRRIHANSDLRDAGHVGRPHDDPTGGAAFHRQRIGAEERVARLEDDLVAGQRGVQGRLQVVLSGRHEPALARDRREGVGVELITGKLRGTLREDGRGGHAAESGHR